LYAQIFYSTHRHWPWAEYAHGGVGLLEAYSETSDKDVAAECLQKLSMAHEWPRIRAALKQTLPIEEDTPCFCSSSDPIKACHLAALQGALKRQKDMRTLGIPCP